MICDAVVVAGNRRNSLSVIGGGNKVFSLIDKVPLVVRVLTTLTQAPSVGKIVVVGNSKKLNDVIKEHLGTYLENGKILVTEQKNSIFGNAWIGFLNSLSEYKNGSEKNEVLLEKYKNKAILFLPADIPLLIPEELEYFISKCDVKKFNFFAGLTSQKTILPFSHKDSLPGIDMACFHLKEGLYRISNLFLAMPCLLKDNEGINTMYKYRYQKNPLNILGLLFNLALRPNFFRMLRHFMLLQVAMLLSHLKQKKASDFLRKICCPMEVIAKDLSILINAKLAVIELPSGGSTIDIDNEKDFKTMGVMFSKWKKILEENKKIYKKTDSPISA